ncbi:MAG: hypothetical protein SVU32_07455, partial [Candidatus Nanohaloarchaea archaeon]|nr:hypothetical protein [Candidatus Nanohaloarchaea archaeon]
QDDQDKPWGYRFHMQTWVRDDDDTVDLRLWVKKDGGSWHINDTASCFDCVNETVQLQTRQFGTNSSSNGWIGDYLWKINGTDAHGQRDNTTRGTFNVTKRNATLDLTSGLIANVTRDGSNTTNVSLVGHLTDSETGNDIGFDRPGAFWVTSNGTGSAVINEDPDITTNTLSQYIKSPSNNPYNPGCDIYPGRQEWQYQFDGTGDYFARNSTENGTLLVYASFNTIIRRPDNAKVYDFGETVTFNATVRSNCRPVPGAELVFNASGPDSITCEGAQVDDKGNGNYSCTIDTDNIPSGSFTQALGVYNVTVNTTKDFYFNDTSFNTSVFQVRDAPALKNVNVDEQVEGWGYPFEFTVEFFDGDTGSNDNVSVTMWKAYSPGGPYQRVETKLVDATLSFVTLDFTNSFTKQDLLNGPEIYYKFNATDEYGLTNETAVHSVTLQKDNITVVPVTDARNSLAPEINRSDGQPGSTQPFRVILNDTDAGHPVGAGVNGSFWFTFDGATNNNYDSGHFVETNASGWLEFQYNPGCSYTTGVQNWKSGLTNSSFYETQNMSFSGENAGFHTIIGELRTQLLHPPNNSRFNVTQDVVFNWTVTDSCGNGVTSANDTFSLQNEDTGDTASPGPVLDEGDGTYNVTWDTTGDDSGNWSITVISDRQYYNRNRTFYHEWLQLFNVPAVAANQTFEPNKTGWTEEVNYSIQVDDNENADVTCTLFVNTTASPGTSWRGEGSDTVQNGDGFCNVSVNDFQPPDIGNTTFKFQVFDGDPANTYNTSVFQGP